MEKFYESSEIWSDRPYPTGMGRQLPFWGVTTGNHESDNFIPVHSHHSKCRMNKKIIEDFVKKYILYIFAKSTLTKDGIM